MDAAISWFALGCIGLIVFAARAWPICVAIRWGRYLTALGDDPPKSAAPPKVSVIVPACNEQDAIQRCLRSLLEQDHANLEIIAVNDRSTDDTAAIMDKLAMEDARLRVVHVGKLPDGWLGKNHANNLGARLAGGDWLLFTDGDVWFAPDCIRLAAAHAEEERLDHLTLLPDLILPGYWERAICCLFGLLLFDFLRPWQVRNPLRPECFYGIGAFNLVRRVAYAAIGAHERLRLEVADDVKLGKLLKHAGFVSDFLAAGPLLTLRWQVGLRGVVRGLEKNGFSGSEYRLWRAGYGVLMLTLFALAPLAGAILAPPWARIVFAAWFASQAAVLGYVSYRNRGSWLVGLGYPIAGAALAYAIARSAVLAIWRGGVYWRGTFYPLARLRDGVV